MLTLITLLALLPAIIPTAIVLYSIQSGSKANRAAHDAFVARIVADRLAELESELAQ